MYINFFKESIKETFEDMYSEVITLVDETIAPKSIISQGVSVIIGITGERKGRVMLDMSISTSIELAARLDPELREEDLSLFAMSEFCNIVSGGAITNINNQNKQSRLRLVSPSIFTGVNTEIIAPNLNTIKLSYCTEFGIIDLYVGFEGA